MNPPLVRGIADQLHGSLLATRFEVRQYDRCVSPAALSSDIALIVVHQLPLALTDLNVPLRL